MTLQTLVSIILWFFAIAITAGLLVAIFFIGRSTVKNDIRKAKIMVSIGEESPVYKGILTDVSKRGCVYSYNQGGKDKKIFVSYKHEVRFNNHKRLLFLNSIGQLIASPFNDDVVLSDDEKNDLIYELVSSHIGADGVRALKGKSLPNVILIGIIAFILGIIVVFGYNYFNQSIALQQTTPPANHNTIIKP